MIYGLIKKEWKKTKNTIILFAILCFTALCFIFFDLNNLQEYNKASLALQELISKERINLTFISNFLIAFGSLLAYVQFYPEVQNARIRLHFHLPLNQSFLINFFPLYSLVILLVFAFITNSFIFISIISFYPIELFWAFQTKLINAYELSILAYLCIAVFLISPSRQIKIAILILSLLIAMIYMDYTSIFFIGENLYKYFIFIFISYYFLLLQAFKTYTKGYIK